MIRDMVLSLMPGRTMSFQRVVKRDDVKHLVWTHTHGETAIPLVGFERAFSYFDTQPSGTLIKRDDPSHTNPNLLTRIITPRVGQTVVILEPWGNQRFPVCLGVILSRGHWTGDE